MSEIRETISLFLNPKVGHDKSVKTSKEETLQGKTVEAAEQSKKPENIKKGRLLKKLAEKFGFNSGK